MKNIPHCVVCPMASCTRSNTCARYAQYVKALTCADTFEVLNVKHLQCEGEKCPYHLVSEKQVWARGFQRIYSTIPSGRTHYLPLFGIRIVHKKVGSLTNILYLYRCFTTSYKYI